MLADGTREAQLLVQGVRCAACSWLIERAMAAVPGVREIAVDPLTTRMRLRWDPAAASLSDLLAGIAALGYDPYPYTEDETDRAALRERRDGAAPADRRGPRHVGGHELRHRPVRGRAPGHGARRSSSSCD